MKRINIAILALGGEGGGVLADWMVHLAESNGYRAQATSVPGVAQRTGATIYYVEMIPEAVTKGREPVFALMPTPGDVDVVIASELMEAARAVERGLVTSDRTTLIVSTHRVFTMTERIASADSRVDAQALLDACGLTSRKLVAFDMAAASAGGESPISAVLYGALSYSRALPFTREQFERAVREYGVGVSSSLAAFQSAYDAAVGTSTLATNSDAAVLQNGSPSWTEQFSPSTRTIIDAGKDRVRSFQDGAYEELYFKRLKRFDSNPGDSERLVAEVARQLALAMAYDDTIRVAELKISAERFARVQSEVKAGANDIIEIAEFMHPRTQEVAETLPAPIGRWLLRTSWARKFVDLFTRSGRTVRTTTLTGFLMLYVLSSLKRLRRGNLRFAIEQKSIEEWLEHVERIAKSDAALATEFARARSVVKGYSDTYERGLEKFVHLGKSVDGFIGKPGGAAAFGKVVDVALNTEELPVIERAIADNAIQLGNLNDDIQKASMVY